ncbi:aspartyl-tRNA(Asn)/glutamyl-tRNA(Gln) amidotransferase subunit C [Candidatus Planktophila versatilis]|jgi:aspartyl-tRNA(Asn)/glutamyl-tRNA(Gln) amidotransferase subunit C|uniref:Aspartyl/glutamyl-tRNA(Asn/Gln) amidotransferase subunit C n=1 Tax=Candidatus Planktophila versatilis TaxID=1884905 RepID=A0AAC9YXP5_9ACTN|nr:Asp-tRNA(Asn)/Glu-tRNA(Gln) amidotransferase subunit GatC [Candidatus Planktophila versatilis]ASY17469.1 aspartyl-tRNA(Asn)/glutamyl-tRNA(Gln) amidotransferase subunit C [Candidatus Planktophila versatilis]ASY18788.1 aspartyl-tRNA(Asn)/glutamyl-tRNA(Gln) amidotransferase subunit C [Candidatus Planktophila versatilis]ASY22804.1 aspartyl-tRNA(Asn)/glutamyl-tRNA(Gln) amidotransferase subunit C [Candidatus Planktophila versatilis]ASY26605.1 aspartyl-tRNA(Asn)/glutamyl-tRNA(Gln) amidotransferase 
MSSLSRDDVAKLAGLARIEMTEEELVSLASQFGMILDAVARVQEVDLTGVKATSHPQLLENIARPDVVLPSLSPTDALSGAPAQEEQRFRVPQILGEAE